MDKNNKLCFTLFKYDSIPVNLNDTTYEEMKAYDNRNCEITGYDNKKNTRKELRSVLGMLKNVFNSYY